MRFRMDTEFGAHFDFIFFFFYTPNLVQAIHTYKAIPKIKNLCLPKKNKIYIHWFYEPSHCTLNILRARCVDTISVVYFSFLCKMNSFLTNCKTDFPAHFKLLIIFTHKKKKIKHKHALMTQSLKPNKKHGKDFKRISVVNAKSVFNQRLK